MSNYTHHYGIDVSKDSLDITLLPSDEHFQIPNTEAGIKKWISEFEDKERTLCIFESTGCYSKRLSYYLNAAGLAFSVVNPSQSDGFTKAQGIVSKNDKQAAHSLALMGKCLDLPLYQQPSDDMQSRKQLLMGIHALKKQGQMLRNQLHALNNQVVFAPQVIEALEQTLSTVKIQLKGLEESLGELEDEEYDKQYALITSVVGVGDKTARLLIAATGGLQHFGTAKQLAKFVGLVPGTHFSGSSIHKQGRITKKGNSELRASLYMGTRSAKRFNKSCKELFERLRKAGKPYKQAVVAVMHKLIKQIFGVVNSGLKFDNQFYLKFKN